MRAHLDLNAGVAAAAAGDSDSDVDLDLDADPSAGTTTPLRYESNDEADVRPVKVRRAARRLFSSDEESDFEDTGVEAAHTHLSDEHHEDDEDL